MSTIPEPIDIVFSFDTTGSMYPCLTQVRRKVEAVIKRLFSQISGLRIGVITHGDYCDAPDTITMLDLTDNVDKICSFVRNAPATYGGDAPECYELVLHKARSLAWRSGKSKVLVMIGDDVPHGPSYPQNTLNLDWRNELGLLMEGNINVYGVQCLARHRSTSFYKEIAEKTGGFHLELHQFSAITDLVMAVCYKQDGAEALNTFEAEVQNSGRMTDNVGACFDIMAGRTPRVVKSSASSWRTSSSARRVIDTLTAKADIDPSKLVPVHPSRFQVLGVDGDCPIKAFVGDNSLAFKTGRGFYQFTKTVTVQPQKEVVLVDDSTGAMFSGDQARTMLGLPNAGVGGNVRLRPSSLPGFTAFIQSTSHNRKLLGGTKFLYEMDDWDREAAA
jgi:hypothetical protein